MGRLSIGALLVLASVAIPASAIPMPDLSLIATPAAPSVVTLAVGSATGKPGEQVTVAVTLFTGGLQVAAIQNDISFNPGSVSVVGCVVNPDIGKDFTAFRYSEAGLRAIVLGDNVDPIPDGSVVYTCTFTIGAGAPTGSSTLYNSHVLASSPAGGLLPVAGTGGAIDILNGRPTRTPAPTRTPLPTPTPAPPLVGIAISTTRGSPGERVTIAATLSTAGVSIAGTQNDIRFDPVNAPIAAKPNGKPDCQVNPDIDKGASSFAFQPSGCSGASCTAVRALVLATDNTDPITEGAVLYTCTVTVAANAADGVYPLVVGGLALSDPNGRQVPNPTAVDGAIVIGDVFDGGHDPYGPYGPPRPARPPVPTTDRAGESAATPAAAPPSSTATATGTAVADPPESDDGCQIGTSTASRAALLFLPAITVLLARRHRRR